MALDYNDAIHIICMSAAAGRCCLRGYPHSCERRGRSGRYHDERKWQSCCRNESCRTESRRSRAEPPSRDVNNRAEKPTRATNGIVFRIPVPGRGPQPVEDIDYGSSIPSIRLIRLREKLSPCAGVFGRPRPGSEVPGRVCEVLARAASSATCLISYANISQNI